MPTPHGTQTGIEVDASGALRKLELVQRAFSLRELLHAIGQAHIEWIGQNVRSAGTGSRWQRMAASTIAARPLRQSPHHFSSNYQREIQQSFVNPAVSESAASVTVGSNLRYIRWHHEGTRPYTIRPRRSRRLVFLGAGGEPVFAREVRHPGLPARPMLPQARTAREIALDLLRRMEERLAAQLRSAGG